MNPPPFQKKGGDFVFATLNLSRVTRDEYLTPSLKIRATEKRHRVETVRPNKPDPIASEKPQGIGTILLRFLILPGVAVTILAVMWSR